ncbi:hypothetical protein [Serpentinicella alkaliphila]|uniref:Sugar phosphate isomerase/epimerase n=1 Tax=Serpentinicella alkaliphila TaxID=1734049 RepID=A0A4R2T556_9FIRM|nr:hypothetical protein [Serpentinicella alkaliphila]TCP97185.1 hypothetical protein EDD79_104713 [Serpentinicella alkaliphila]
MTNLKKYMKVGIVHFMTFPEIIRGEGPIIETVKKIDKYEYFDAIEISWIKDKDGREKVAK